MKKNKLLSIITPIITTGCVIPAFGCLASCGTDEKKDEVPTVKMNMSNFTSINELNSITTPLTISYKTDENKPVDVTFKVPSTIADKISFQYRIATKITRNGIVWPDEWVDVSSKILAGATSVTGSMDKLHPMQIRARANNDADNGTFSNATNKIHISSNASPSLLYEGEGFELYGSLTSLLCKANTWDGVTTLDPTNAQYCFSELFAETDTDYCMAIEKVSPSLLPFTTLSKYCYKDMFKGDGLLSSAPALPATTLAEGCYQGMFKDCDNLSTAPFLPAKALADGCYVDMFNGCESLKTASLAYVGPLLTKFFGNWLSLGRESGESTDGILIYNGLDRSTEDGAIPEGWTVKEDESIKSQIKTITINDDSSLKLGERSSQITGTRKFNVYKDATWSDIKNQLPTITTLNQLTVLSWYKLVGTTKTELNITDSTKLSDLPSNIYASYVWKATIYNDCNNFVSKKGFTIKLASAASGCDLQYSYDHEHWNSFGTTTLVVPKYTNFYLKGKVGSDATDNFTNIVVTDGSVELYGKITHLINGSTNLSAYGCKELFKGSTAITSVPLNYLTGVTVNDMCYADMFSGCTALTQAPNLTSASTSPGCYSGMFYACSSLKTAPTISASSIAEPKQEGKWYQFTKTYTGTCSYMFAYCTSLTTVPALTATSVGCIGYDSMFMGCTALTKAPEIKATSFSEGRKFTDYGICGGCNEMFSGCTALVTPPSKLNTSTAESGCFRKMFYNCKNLTSTPYLYLTKMRKNVCCEMFSGCSALTSAGNITLKDSDGSSGHYEDNCCKMMFVNCINLTIPPTMNDANLYEGDECCVSTFNGCSKLRVTKDKNKHPGCKAFFYMWNDQGWNNEAEYMFSNTGGDATGTPSDETWYYYY